MTDAPPLLTKCCTKCGEWKPHDAYYRNPTTRDRLASWCKDCAKARYVRKKPEKPACIPEGSKRCSACLEVKPATEFYRKSRARDGLKPECKACGAKWVRPKRRRPTHELPPEKQQQRREAWRKYHYKRQNSPELLEVQRERYRQRYLRAAIAIDACEKLGVDLDTLVKEARREISNSQRTF